MSYQSVFQRYEYKYIISKKQKDKILEKMKEHMKEDVYGRTTIRNIYYDTDNYRLIRHSIEKPVYKEKLRVRSYSTVKDEDLVFLELKKKHKAIVYKRRVAIPYRLVDEWICNNKKLNLNTQIEREIKYFVDYYKNLKPHVFLSYEREAYVAFDEVDFRVTFDENILWRQEEISLTKEPFGQKILDDDKVLMEIKTSRAIPLWMTHLLTEEKIYKRSFSKYGNAYEEIFSQID